VKTIDLNADLGEGCDDAAVMPHLTSANIACGFHAGDAATMRRTVELCVRHGVAIGAHPSLHDPQHFGRRELEVDADEVHAQTLYQIGALDAFARAAGTRLHHVKPHGALYNMAAREYALAEAIARAVHDYDPSLILVGLAGSASIDAARAAGLRTANEAFCDRRYRADGSLLPRSQTGAVIEDIDAAVAQAVSIALHGEAVAEDGIRVGIAVDTLCVHGDHDNAGELAQRLRDALEHSGLRIAAPERA